MSTAQACLVHGPPPESRGGVFTGGDPLLVVVLTGGAFDDPVVVVLWSFEMFGCRLEHVVHPRLVLDEDVVGLRTHAVFAEDVECANADGGRGGCDFSFCDGDDVRKCGLESRARKAADVRRREDVFRDVRFDLLLDFW